MTTLDHLRRLTTSFVPAAAAGLRCTIQFHCSSTACLVIRDGTCTPFDGTVPDPELILTMNDDDLVGWMTGREVGMQLFLADRMKVDGDLLLGQRLGELFDPGKLGA